MADHAIVAADAPRNDTTQSNNQTDSNRDDTILAAFRAWQQAHAALAELRTANDEAEKTLWAAIDAADVEIQTLRATSPEAIATKLWLAIVHSTPDHETEEACCRRDLEWLEAQGKAPDWNLRLLISALRDLKSMEG